MCATRSCLKNGPKLMYRQITDEGTAQGVATLPQWTPLIRRVAADDDGATEELYAAFNGLRRYFDRQLGAECVQDAFHEVILTLIVHIRSGRLRNPERIAGYVMTIARRHVAETIRVRIRSRSHCVRADDIELRDRAPNAEGRLLQREQREIARRVLHAMPKTDREILVRYYLEEQRPEVIQAALHITPTLFRLIKWRAKARFTELCRNAQGGHVERSG